MPYDFITLSPADFEDLSTDLVGRELGVRFDVFASGPDGGADGRHTKSGLSTILQAKHYANSLFSVLKSQMRKEKLSIETLSPDTYILTTSCRITAANKVELIDIIASAASGSCEIYGPRDLNGLLRKFPEVEKSHIKLWLSGAPVLQRVLRAAAHAYNSITHKEIEAKIRVFASNPSFDQALTKLGVNNVLIVSGPPGVGKSTLAEMLSYSFLADGWELVALRSLEDGFASIDDGKRQIFLFDDFLGRVALDHKALAHTDSDLAKFIKRVRSSPHARFILTTRAYIFEEARQVSEHLADQSLDVSKYVLDVGLYTRRIKARILYNHLLAAETPLAHIAALFESGDLVRIVDHKNYNPRIIEWMTDRSRTSQTEPSDYPNSFIYALDNPANIWDIAFRNHISPASQHLLIALFFCSEYGAELEDLKVAFDALHETMCHKYALTQGPKNFEESLKTLEGGFLKIAETKVTFINPSLRDYLVNYLHDAPLLMLCAQSARQTDWAQVVWKQRKKFDISEHDSRSLAMAFVRIAKEFAVLPLWRRVPHGNGWQMHAIGLSNIDRLELLIDWWGCTNEDVFAKTALKLASAPIEGLDSWRDGAEAIELYAKLRDGDYYEFPDTEELIERLEISICAMLDNLIVLDELESISDTGERWTKFLSPKVNLALEEAIRLSLKSIGDLISDIDSESTLQDYVQTIERLARRTSTLPADVKNAVACVNSRMEALSEKVSHSSSPPPDLRARPTVDTFSDAELNGLFAPLLEVSR